MKQPTKEESENIQAYILLSGIATEEQYAQTKWEIAQKFLEKVYGNDIRLIGEIDKDPRFWRWWDLEWKETEKFLFIHARQMEREITTEAWQRFMEDLAFEIYTQKSFNNYLKLCRNVRQKKERKADQLPTRTGKSSIKPFSGNREKIRRA